MDDEWDLHAVVRSCTTASAASSAATTAAAAADDDEKFQSFSFQSDENSFLYPSFMENQSSYRSEGLEEIYRESYLLPPLITATMSAGAATVGNPVQEEGAYDRIFQDSHIFAIQGMNSQSNRYRKRKNQQKKIVRQMTQEELSNDSWAWRKYGQKPIKGSPYPRNYYRCSTSKGCGARKQVERSPTDPTIFIVSYTGEHTHPRPTHRSSLAGSTRSKNTSTTENKTPAMISGNTSYNPLPPCSSSSPVSASSFSPPIMEEDEEEGGEMTQGYDDGDGGGDDNEILIPNITVTEEILKGFQELNTGRGGFFSPPPSWPPGCDC